MLLVKIVKNHWVFPFREARKDRDGDRCHFQELSAGEDRYFFELSLLSDVLHQIEAFSTETSLTFSFSLPSSSLLLERILRFFISLLLAI